MSAATPVPQAGVVSRSDGKIPVAARPSEPRTGGRSATYPADVDLDDILPVSRRLRPVDDVAERVVQELDSRAQV